MSKIARIGIDTSKGSFQLHGVNEKEEVVLRRTVRRRQFLEFMAKLEPTVVGLEACGASHHWARELSRLGHRVMLIAPQRVKPYVSPGRKNDKNDAEAICEAMSRPRVRERLVPIKSVEQSASQMLLGVREGLLKRRTQLGNSIRGHAAEFGLVAAKGVDKIEPLLARIAGDEGLPALAREMFGELGQQHAELSAQVARIERKLAAFHRSNELSRRLMEIPIVGPVGAGLMITKIVDPHGFRSGRMCAAWTGLTPKDHSTAGKQKLGGITRAGDESLRAVLVSGATAYIQQVRRGRIVPSPWLAALLERKPPKLVAVALANKTMRIAWKLMTSGERYDPTHGVGREGLGASLYGGLRAEPLAPSPTAGHSHAVAA
jgi:transposase